MNVNFFIVFRKSASCFFVILYSIGCMGQNAVEHGRIIVGEPTNNIRAELEAVSPGESNRPSELIIWVRDLSVVKFTAAEVSSNLHNQDWTFYLPGNCFCGPVEIRDASGVQIPLIKSNVSALTNYPASYSLKAERSDYFRRSELHFGPNVFPIPVMAFSPRSEMFRFELCTITQSEEPRLNDPFAVAPESLINYFDIREPGEYTFTVWPKIYKRVSTNSDICERIDLPPVSVTFNWDGNSKK